MSWVCPSCEYENDAADATCAACEEARPAGGAAVTAGSDDDDDYRFFKVGKITACEDIPNSKLRRLKVDIGAGAHVDVVTAAGNVKEGVHVVIACVGATIQGEEVKKTNVKGFPSCGMVCDSGMLGWSGGGAGAAVLLPESFVVGSKPPTTRPRGDAAA